GREALLMDSVVMATADITPGVEIKKEFLTMGKVLKENRIQGSFDGAQLDSLIGQTSNQLILKNGQISTVYFKGKDLTLKKKESIFVIKAEWIYMVSSSLRRGDLVEIYGPELIGTYRVAFVKDKEKREVYDTGTMVKNRENFIERTDSTTMIDHIEIICTLWDFQKIKGCAEGMELPGITIVQKEAL
ncbi:MAG: hypothetical protein RR361_07810, partial [Anaerovorax sp.]